MGSLLGGARNGRYRRFFATTIEFNQEFNGIVCNVQDLDAPVPSADPRMARHVQDYLDTIASRPHATTGAKVRECIYMMLASGLCSAAHVAKRLGTDRRTMHRHLAKEGETFSSLLDSVRSELATRYIDNRDRPLTTTAELLGFSALSAFSRWFRGKFGCSVSQWRATQLDAASVSSRAGATK